MCLEKSVVQWGIFETKFRAEVSSNNVKHCLIVSGSIHQAERRFSDVSRGRQCAFISFSALLHANSCHVSQWTAGTVDQILTEGDAMYVKAFDDGTIPDTETLLLTHLPDQVCWPTVTADPAKLNQLPTARPANTRLKSKAKD